MPQMYAVDNGVKVGLPQLWRSVSSMTTDQDGISWITDVIHVTAGCDTAGIGMDGQGGHFIHG